MPRSPQIATLQAGRAVAAIVVVIYHAAQMTVGITGPFPGSALLLRGELGVDFFFVLSGFIIYHSVPGKTLSSYVRSRARRVYLPYLPVGIGMALFLTAIGSTDGWSWFASLSLAPLGRPALPVAWTLQHELVFYAVFALSYYSGRLVLGLGLWAVLILAAALLDLSAIPLALINLEFLMGIGAAMAIQRGWGDWRWYAVATLPLAAWMILGAKTQGSVLVGSAFALAMVPLIRRERDGMIQVPVALLFLGEASYSIYLVHVVAISTVARLVSGWPLILGVSSIAGIAAGIGYYLAVERRLIGAKRSEPAQVLAAHSS